MAIVQKHRARVREVRRILPDVLSAAFESLDRPFRFRPGQFLHLALDPYDPTRPWPESRCFSIQSAPAVGSRVLRIAVAVKGAFTQRLASELLPEREVWLKLPYGDLFRPSDAERPCVFIAGGTGLTPFLSLFLADEFRRYARASLYLGVRSPAYHVFAPELEEAVHSNPAFAVEVFSEDTQGLIPVDRIATTHGQGTVYFLSGPPAMIRAFRNRLRSAGVPAEDVRSDDWE